MAETTKPATMREHWQDALQTMQRAYPAALYLQRLTPVAYQSGALTVAAPDEWTLAMALRSQRVISQYLQATACRDVTVLYVIDGGAPC